MTKMLVFDMDGTIANLYGVSNWLTDLESESVRPYAEAEPLYNMLELTNLLYKLKKSGWKIAITTWLAMHGTKEYNKAVTETKKAWLAKYNFPYDEIHCIKYGTTKANCTRYKADFQILIDDNEKIRNGWTLGDTIDATKNILPILENLIDSI